MASHSLIAADVFDINRPDSNVADINEEESIDQAQDRHNRGEIIDVIITFDINEQAAHMHANKVTEEAMRLFDNLMESDENVENIIQLLDMSKKRRISKLWIQYIKMLGILTKFIKAERTGNGMLHLLTVRNMLPNFAATNHNAYTKEGHIFLCRMEYLKHLILML